MKTFFVSIIGIFFVVSQLHAIETVVIQPDSTTGKDATVNSYTPSKNSGNSELLQSSAWTVGSGTALMRFYVDFNSIYDSLPENALVMSVSLSLMEAHAETPTYGHFYQLGSNACFVRRVLNQWDEGLISWNSQPEFTVKNQIELSASTAINQNYTNIDVTQLYLDAKNDQDSSLSLVVMMKEEVGYRSMMFASSEHSDVAKRPKLAIRYVVPGNDSIIVLQPDAEFGKDAYTHSYYPQANISSDSILQLVAWSISGSTAKLRSYIDFKIPNVGDEYRIDTAMLSLYEAHAEQTATQGHSHASGSNEFYIKRVTSPWNDKTITWGNQPAVTTVNQVLVPGDTISTQDFVDINVTSLVRDIVADSIYGGGFMLQLKNEQPYRTIMLASSNHSNPLKRPKLVIKLSKIGTVTTVKAPVRASSLVYPNPVSQLATFCFENNGTSRYDVKMFNLQGKLLIEKAGVESDSVEINAANFTDGVYLLSLFKDGIKVTTEKLVIKK